MYPEENFTDECKIKFNIFKIIIINKKIYIFLFNNNFQKDQKQEKNLISPA